MDNTWQSRITLLVNTCDAYSDLWFPFFTLLKRYFIPLNMRILVNTESKRCVFDGLEIETVNSSGSYGQRMRYALKTVKTEYVLLLLDDFFLRRPVNMERLHNIISWMDQDPDIVYFNSDLTETSLDLELNRYPGYRRLPTGNRYTLNLQAAVWRTKKFLKYWNHGVSPWDWEERCNVLTANHPKDKFYCLYRDDSRFIDYGYHPGQWMGICHGQWVESDVVPLFKKEKIFIDFSKRGFLDPKQRPSSLESGLTRQERYKQIKKCLGIWYLIPYFIFCRRCNLYSFWHHCAVNEDYFAYLQRKIDIRNTTGKHLLFGPMET